MVELNGTLLISILNFIILVAVLAHFCYKPVLKVMDDRRNKIRNDLDSAARSSAEAAKLKSDLKAELANAQDRKSTRLNSSHNRESRMPSSA